MAQDVRSLHQVIDERRNERRVDGAGKTRGHPGARMTRRDRLQADFAGRDAARA
jgi:hypothetical protein